MSDNDCNVFYARNLTEIFYHLKTISALKIVGGCTSIQKMPQKAISTIYVPELKTINKHERYIEFGPGTFLSNILSLGERNLPKILVDAIKSTATPFIRNIATIGGNILHDNCQYSLYAPLLALDSSLEFKSPSETTYTSMLNFKQIPEGSVLTKIRVPLNDWDISIYSRLGPEHQITENTAHFAFLVETDKSIINNLKIAFAGKLAFRAQELENRLLGLRLPLNSKEIANYVNDAAIQFDKTYENESYPPVLRQQFLNLIRYSFEQLT